MNLKYRGCVFVPPEFDREISKMSKAALMDMVWDYCVRAVGEAEAITEFRETRAIILGHRKAYAVRFSANTPSAGSSE